MLIECRTYTFRPGNLEAFWKAQPVRGFDPATRPIMARVIAYFSTLSGPQDQIVHLWRFDSYEDWFARLFYKHPDAEPYYKLVRPLMLLQENRFFVPAPVAELSPLWGAGRDWMPGGPTLADLAVHPQLVVEEITVALVPGTLPDYWQAWRDHGVGAGKLVTEGLIGCFYTLVGRQHQVTLYRWHADFAAREAQTARLRAHPAWQTFLGTVRASVLSDEVRLLKPTPHPQMAPLFRYPGAAN